MNGRMLSYLKVYVHRYTNGFSPLTVFSIGPTPPDRITYTLVSGLLEIAFKRKDLTQVIHTTLWNYGRTIIQLMETVDGKSPI
jgi:phosphatidylinositol 4-kinase